MGALESHPRREAGAGKPTALDGRNREGRVATGKAYASRTHIPSKGHDVKKGFLFIALTTLLWSGTALAATVNLTGAFTADNFSWTYSLRDLTADGSEIANGQKLSDWRTAQTLGSIELILGHKYELTFYNGNEGNVGNDNPSAFLADISIGGVKHLTGVSAEWSIFGYASTMGVYQANGDLNSKWGQVKGSPVSGISNDARWIGDGPYPGSNFYAARLTTTATPIPTAVWLLGSGLLAIVGLRRRFNG